MKRYYLGLDLGTSALKVVLTDEERKVISQSNIVYEISHPSNGWSEIDPAIWEEAMYKGIAEVTGDINNDCIRGIGVTGQMHTLVTLDGEGKPLRPALMWNDRRTGEFIPFLKQVSIDKGFGEYIHKNLSTGSPLSNLYWLREREPFEFAKIGKFLIGPDYLTYLLTGKCSTDFCDASTSCLFDTDKLTWSEPVREFLGLPVSVYPEVKGCACSLGVIKPEIANKIGLPHNIFIMNATGDNAASAISCGLIGNHQPMISLGTSGVMMMSFDKLLREAKGKKIVVSLNGTKVFYVVQGTVQSTGSTIDWWIKKIARDDYSLMDSVMENGKPAETSLIFYPHVMGEKTIYCDPELRGVFLNVSIEHSRKDFMLAIMEGIAMGLKQLSEEMHFTMDQAKSIYVIGGGAKNDAWMQILADVFHKNVIRLGGSVGAAYGSTVLAACYDSGMEYGKSFMEGVVYPEKVFHPIEERHSYIERKYEKYLKIHDALCKIQ